MTYPTRSKVDENKLRYIQLISQWFYTKRYSKGNRVQVPRGRKV